MSIAPRTTSGQRQECRQDCQSSCPSPLHIFTSLSLTVRDLQRAAGLIPALWPDGEHQARRSLGLSGCK
jgi:hypothetical protein